MVLSTATEAELFGQLIDLAESERMPALQPAGLDADAADALDLEICEVFYSWAETSELEADARLDASARSELASAY